MEFPLPSVMTVSDPTCCSVRSPNSSIPVTSLRSINSPVAVATKSEMVSSPQPSLKSNTSRPEPPKSRSFPSPPSRVSSPPPPFSCQRRRKSRPLGGAKVGQSGRDRRLGKRAPHIADGCQGALVRKDQSERGSGVLPGLALSEAIAVAVHFQNADMVCQAIEQGPCETL